MVFILLDEAAPPALIESPQFRNRQRKLTVSWWTNIRFEKSFNRDLMLVTKGCRMHRRFW
jgi:hypothetical protein